MPRKRLFFALCTYFSIFETDFKIFLDERKFGPSSASKSSVFRFPRANFPTHRADLFNKTYSKETFFALISPPNFFSIQFSRLLGGVSDEKSGWDWMIHLSILNFWCFIHSFVRRNSPPFWNVYFAVSCWDVLDKGRWNYRSFLRNCCFNNGGSMSTVWTIFFISKKWW